MVGTLSAANNAVGISAAPLVMIRKSRREIIQQSAPVSAGEGTNLLPTNGAQQLLRRFSRILDGEFFVENEERNRRIDLLQHLPRRSAVHRLHVGGNHYDFRLRSFQQDLGVVDVPGGHGVVSGSEQHLLEEGANVRSLEEAKYARPLIAAFPSRIARA